MKMELKHCLQLCCLIVAVHGRPMESNPDRKMHYCGPKISEIISSVCITTNHGSGGRGGTQKGIVTQCCDDPCTLRELSQYCGEIKPEIEEILNLTRNAPPLSNSIIQESSDQVEDAPITSTPLPRAKLVSKQIFRNRKNRCRRRKHRNHNCRNIRGANHSSHSPTTTPLTKGKQIKQRKRKCPCCKRRYGKTGKYKKVLHPTVYKSAEVGFDTSSSTFIISTPYNHNEFLAAI